MNSMLPRRFHYCLRSICLLAAAALACAWGEPPPARPAASSRSASQAVRPTDLRVMTFNIRYGTAPDGRNAWKHRRPLIADMLRRERPDLIGLQEALRFQLDELRTDHPGYGQIGVGRDDGKEAGEYSAILYLTSRLRPSNEGTFWFSDTPDKPGSISWGNACTRICTRARFADAATGRVFYLFNVHLDHVSQPSREKSAALLLAKIARRESADPVLVTGDFNAGESNPAIRRLLDPANTPRLLDTFRVLHPDEKQAGTFNGFKGDRAGDKIDYILCPADAAVLDARILHDHRGDTYLSDHYPVTAVVRLP